MRFLYYILLLFPILCFSQTPPENYTREWGTYFGSDDMHIADETLDDNGNLWVGGVVRSVSSDYFDEIVTPNAHQATYGGGNGNAGDGFIAQFSPDGALLYATYFGGEFGDVILSIDVRGGKVYVTGETMSETGIATSGSYQENLLENTMPDGSTTSQSGFIAKFDVATGQQDWGTYYQGDRGTGLHQIATGANSLYVSGTTTSSDLGTSGAFKETIVPPYIDDDGEEVTPYYPVLAKFDDTGQLDWATYYAPDIEDEDDPGSYSSYHDLGVDSSGNVYFCATTNATNYYGTTGVHQETNEGNGDIFLSKFSPTGQRLWSTYYGGTGIEGFPKILVPNSDHIYLSGMTSSSTGIATADAWQSSPSINSSFVAKFTLTGQRVWGTYIAKNYVESVPIDLDSNLNLFLSTGTDEMSIATGGSWQESLGGERDLIVMKMNVAGDNLLWGSYYGGNNDEGPSAYYAGQSNSINISDNDEIYFSGYTNSHNNIASEGAFQDSYETSPNFIAKFIPCPESEEPIATATQEFQPNQGKTLENLTVEIPEWSGSEPLVTWYADEDGEEEISESTELEDGETYYISRRIQGCDESGLVEITVEACQPPEPPTGTSPQGFDDGDTLADLQVEGENLRWYIDEEMTEEIPETTELENGTTYYISQTVADCESELMSITVDEDLSVSTENFHQVKLFPNPNNGNFQLTGLPSEEVKLRIYDLHGRVLYNKTLAKNEETHAITLQQQLSAGIYFVDLHSTQQYQNFKMVVE